MSDILAAEPARKNNVGCMCRVGGCRKMEGQMGGSEAQAGKAIRCG